VVPLLSLLVPVMYLTINYYGQARVFAAYEEEKTSKASVGLSYLASDMNSDGYICLPTCKVVQHLSLTFRR